MLYGDKGNDTLNGDSGNDFLYGGDNDDKLYGDEEVDLFFGDDELYGEKGKDELYGRSGDDKLGGGAGNDSLYGGTGNDNLKGDAGKDLLIGVEPSLLNPGKDEIDIFSGGKDSDTFVLGNQANVYYRGGEDSDYALITDFNSKADKIQLKGSANDYTLAKSPDGIPKGTAIYHNSAVDVMFLADVSESFEAGRSVFQALAQDLMNDLKDINPNVQFGLGSFDDYPEYPYGLNRRYETVDEVVIEYERVIVGYEREIIDSSNEAEFFGGRGYWTIYGDYKPIYSDVASERVVSKQVPVVQLSSDSSGIVDLIPQQELIGIVQGSSKFNLNANYFTYV